MKMISSLASVSLAALTLIGSLQTAKAEIQYLISGTFDDGASVFGYFDIGSGSSGYVGAYHLTTTLGTLLDTPSNVPYAGFTYVSGVINTVGSPGTPPFSAIDFLPGSYDGGLQLTFSKPLGSYGPDSLVAGELGPSWENVSYLAGGAPIRYLISGTATAVPEPSTWAMLWLGFAGLGWAAYRRSTSKGAKALADGMAGTSA